MVRLLSSSPCGEEGECLAVGPGLEHIAGVASAEDCQQLCWERRNTCNYFTFYNQSANYGKGRVQKYLLGPSLVVGYRKSPKLRDLSNEQCLGGVKDEENPLIQFKKTF